MRRKVVGTFELISAPDSLEALFRRPGIEVGRAVPAVLSSTEARLELPLATPFESIVRPGYCDILLGKSSSSTQKLQKLARVSKTTPMA